MFFLINGDYKNSATGLFNAFRRNLEQVHRQLTILVFLLGYSQYNDAKIFTFILP